MILDLTIGTDASQGIGGSRRPIFTRNHHSNSSCLIGVHRRASAVEIVVLNQIIHLISIKKI